MRYALIDISTNRVMNVVEVEANDGSTPAQETVLVQSDTASIGDKWDGTSIIPQPQPAQRVI